MNVRYSVRARCVVFLRPTIKAFYLIALIDLISLFCASNTANYKRDANNLIDVGSKKQYTGRLPVFGAQTPLGQC